MHCPIFNVPRGDHLGKLRIAGVLGACQGTCAQAPALYQLGACLNAALTPFPQVSDDEIYLVVNAGCRDKDLAHFGKHLDIAKVGGLSA